MSVQLDKTAFKNRLKSIYDSWNSAEQNDDYASIADVGALLIVMGEQDEVLSSMKGAAFQTWLLGFEFPVTFTLFEKDKVTFICSPKKARYLQQIKDLDTVVPVEVLMTAAPKEPPNDSLSKFADLYKAHKKVGSLLKEQPTGKLVNEWHTLTKEKPEMVDISVPISAFIAVRDAEELKSVRTASSMSSVLFSQYVLPKLESILDKESVTTHEQFSASIDNRIGNTEADKPPDMKVWQKLKGAGGDIDWPSVELAYQTLVQSKTSSTGYNFKIGSESTQDNIAHAGVFLISAGIRYKGFNSQAARTFIVAPDKEQETMYNLLLALQKEVVAVMKEGASAKEVYNKCLDYIKREKPDAEKNFVKNVGYSMGFQLKDSNFLLSPKSSRVLRNDMIFFLHIGFTDLEDKKGKKYSIQLGDTVRITKERGVLLTDDTKSVGDTLFFENIAEEKPAKKSTNGSARPKADTKVVGGKVLRNKTRGAAQDEATVSALARLREHQAELHTQLQAQGLEKFSEQGDGATGKEGKGWKRFQSYKGEAGLPREAEQPRIYVDRKNQTVLMPIYGFMVPFHINTIKNASKTEEGDLTLLRINFNTPGQGGKKEDTPFEDPDATFIRSLSYRSSDGHRFDSIHKQITELKKEVNKREQTKKEMADVVEQESLLEVKGRRPVRLPEVFIRPNLDGKRLPGEVEIHQNGIRYVSPVGSGKVDVLFSNIKHLFFQRCDKELLVIIHINLKSPIIIGKKKSYDVQFFREASDVQFDETGNRKRKHRYGDEDEIEMEQQDRKRRQALNKEFKAFAENIAQAASNSEGDAIDVDAPFRDLAFEGVPFRTNVNLMPTTECLVHLSEPPFLVATLSDIEIASLERVQFGLKQFDLVFIWKDYSKAPLSVNSIPTTQLEDVKNWLDSVDIPLAESPVNLNWGPIMKTINESPHDFFNEGGWTFLGSGGNEGSDAEAESSEESEFDAEEAASEDSTDDESAFSASDVSDESEEYSGGDESDEGDDWDTLEKKAIKSDQKRAEGRKGSYDSDDEAPKKSKSKSKSKR